MASLPPRREALYLSSLAAGLTGLLAADGVAFLAAVLAEAAYGQPDLSSLLDWLLVMVCCQVSFFGFAAFCATLTGHILALPAVCLVLQFTAVTVEMTVRHLLRYMVFGVGPTRWSDLALQRLSPLYYLCQDPGTRSMEFLTDPVTFQIQDVALKDAGLFAAYAAAGVVLAGLGLAIFRRRRMELAGDVVAVPVLKPVFRWCLALAAGLGVCRLCAGTDLFGPEKRRNPGGGGTGPDPAAGGLRRLVCRGYAYEKDIPGVPAPLERLAAVLRDPAAADRSGPPGCNGVPAPCTCPGGGHGGEPGREHPIGDASGPGKYPGGPGPA